MKKISKIARALVLVLGLGLVTAPAFAADVDGTWTGELATATGNVPITFVFKADGSTLTGHMLDMDRAEIPIDNGLIDGDTISYTVTLDFGGTPLEIIYNGVVAATDIQLSGSVFDRPFELTVKKAD